MMTAKSWAAAMIAACLLPTVVDAATMMKKYKVVSTFSSGAVSSLTQEVTLTFDPTLRTSPVLAAPTYSSSSAITAFNPTDGVSAQQTYRTTAVSLYVYGTTSGWTFKAGVPDFLLLFDVNSAGELTTARGQQPYLEYSTGSGATVVADRVTVSEVSTSSATAMPEPATWGLMLIGFGAVAASLRHRPIRRRSRRPA